MRAHWFLAVTCLASAFAPYRPPRARTHRTATALAGRKRGRGGKDAAEPPPEPKRKKKGSSAAAKAAELAAEALQPKTQAAAPAGRLTAKQKIAARRGGQDAAETSEDDDAAAPRRERKERAAQDEASFETRLRLRGVAAAERAYAAAELLAEAAVAGREYSRDASEAAAIDQRGGRAARDPCAVPSNEDDAAADRRSLRAAARRLRDVEDGLCLAELGRGARRRRGRELEIWRR
mmetsp:Transcript_33061/g.99611  ORF Transcript_33061/g.99611 Transcript_33061/m.99611 type:complete len:235 (+) Transcript_33061:1152-1856(+)